MKNIYIASPLGFSEAWENFYYEEFLPLVERCGVTPLDPWATNPEPPDIDASKSEWEKFNMLTGQINADSITVSDGMLAVLDGADVDSGTASEIGYAFALGKRILGYRGDFRLTGDNPGSVVNLQVEYFIRKSGGLVVCSLKELEETIPKIFSELDVPPHRLHS